MNSRLRKNELCPLHRSKVCCGRVESQKQQGTRAKRFLGPVEKLPDGRERCTLSEMRRRKMELLRGHPFCGACGAQFTDVREVELGHIVSKGMGGFRRDDSRSNLFLIHATENREMGSKCLADYLVWRKEKGLPTP